MTSEDEKQILLVNNTSKLTANICFINSSIQLLRNTGFVKFILSNKTYLNNDMEVSRALADLIGGQTAQEKSAGKIRKLVADKTNRVDFNNQSQQDVEEFMRALVEVICEELSGVDGFECVRKKHFGVEGISKIFLDNLPMGTCFKCLEFPSYRNEDFLFLKLVVPQSSRKVMLTTLIQSYCTDNSDFLWMKCSNCCPHAQMKVVCPQVGFCRRKAATRNELIELPEYLLITLLRFGDQNKVNTCVEFGEEVIFPSGDRYTPISNVSHIGESRHGGHYVNYSKSLSGS